MDAAQALASATIFAGTILGYNEKHQLELTSAGGLEFEIIHNFNQRGVLIRISRLWELTEQDVLFIMETNDILKGKLTITKTGEINVHFPAQS